MAITTDLNTAIGQVRFEIGDDAENAGALPNGANFSDPQVTYALDQTGANVKAAAALLAGVCASKWAGLPQSFSADGLSVNRGDVAARYRDLSARLEGEAAEQGYGNAGGVVGVMNVRNVNDPYAALTDEEARLFT